MKLLTSFIFILLFSLQLFSENLDPVAYWELESNINKISKKEGLVLEEEIFLSDVNYFYNFIEKSSIEWEKNNINLNKNVFNPIYSQESLNILYIKLFKEFVAKDNNNISISQIDPIEAIHEYIMLSKLIKNSNYEKEIKDLLNNNPNKFKEIFLTEYIKANLFVIPYNYNVKINLPKRDNNLFYSLLPFYGNESISNSKINIGNNKILPATAYNKYMNFIYNICELYFFYKKINPKGDMTSFKKDLEGIINKASNSNNYYKFLSAFYIKTKLAIIIVPEFLELYKSEKEKEILIVLKKYEDIIREKEKEKDYH